MTEQMRGVDPRQRELLNDLVQLRLAADEGSLERVQDELASFSQTVSRDRQLQAALTDRSVDIEAREALVEGLLSTAGAHQRTLLLAKRAVTGRERSFIKAVQNYLDYAAQLRNHARATATSAQPLTGEQSERLRTQLERIYGRPVDVAFVVDESVIGGVRVTVDDEVIDGTVVTRLAQARQQLG